MTAPGEKNKPTKTGLEIAVIGMAGKFPGAGTINEFWENLKNGVCSIWFFNQRELQEAGIDEQLLANPGYVKAKGCLEDTEYFDQAFFNYTPKEAELMDPQLRIFHECAWAALEDAGYNPGTYPGLIGVYAGASPDMPWITGTLGQSDSPSREFDTFNLNSGFSFATRVSYNLNLKGPALTVQTACSTSLVSIHLACQGLLNVECDIALAGGVGIASDSRSGYLYQEGMIGSPDGQCRAFDLRARGTNRGDGVGIVVLKRLEEALEDGDYIYALVKGTAINNDGSRKIGYTAPSVEGQAEVIKAAQEAAEVEPGSISYIEAHGTGTSLGDPIEIEGIILAFKGLAGAPPAREYSCAIGSVKTNIGHLDNAAGAASFIKTVLALNHRMIPPSLHYETPNPGIEIENSPFYVNTRLQEWKNDFYPLRAGVSSFGIGGTNAHAVLEEAPARVTQPSPAREYQLILLSARTEAGLDRMTENLAEYFRKNLLHPGNPGNPVNPGQHPELTLADAAYTLQVGRKTFKYRGFTVCTSIDEAIKNLSPAKAGENPLQILSCPETDRPVLFMFPGQGSQYVNMGRQLYNTEPVFHQEMDRCFEILTPLLKFDIKEIIYPSDRSDRSDILINQTEIAQPALFIIEYALAKLLMAWGITPSAMIGHSIGEYTAACLAGVFSLEDALTLVAWRGKLMQQMPPGAMISVSLSEKELLPLLENQQLSLAAVNGPGHCVVSGTKELVDSFAKQLNEKHYENRLLHTSHAFHSQMMDPIVKKFEEKVKEITLKKPQLPFPANVTGQWFTDEAALDPGYWAIHLRSTVRFFDGMTALLEKEVNPVLVEVGPGRVLSTLVRQHPGKKPGHQVVHLLRHPKENTAGHRFLLEKIGRLWQWGVKINWTGFYQDEKRSRVPLPTYSFEKQFFAAIPGMHQNKIQVAAGKEFPGAGPGKRPDIADWFYIPSWKGVCLSTAKPVPMTLDDRWMVFMDECGLGSHLVKQLQKQQQPVITVSRGPTFKKEEPDAFFINPQQEEDYDRLFKALQLQHLMPTRIIHLWAVTDQHSGIPVHQADQVLDSCFYSLLHIARSVSAGRQKISKTMHLEVISTDLQEVVGTETLCPAKATLLGAVKVIPQEYPRISCRSIDIQLPQPGGIRQVADDLLKEFTTGYDETANVVALRGHRRWVRGFEPFRIDQTWASIQVPRLKQKGVYLVTGGLGGIGLVLAEELAKKWQARLVLTGRSDFPPPGKWHQWLAAHKHDPADPVSLKIRHLLHIEKYGAETMVCKADAADRQQMQTVIAGAEERFGPINGIIHAAGLPDGGVIQGRTRQQSEAVLAPKVKGTLVLDSLFQTHPLDFFLLCSSLSSVLAPLGQVAYCAANNFLDAFALHKNAAHSTFTLAIDWDAWQEVGMAAAAVEQWTDSQKVAHPLLHRCIKESPDLQIYISHLSAPQYWVLDEHRIMGKATLPGTAYLEMARAAFEHHTGKKQLEITDLYLLNPLTIKDDEQETKILHTILKHQENHFEFSVKSRTSGGQNQWQEHARGKITPLQPGNQGSDPFAAVHDLQAIAAQCRHDADEIDRTGDETDIQKKFIKPGPRWDNLIRVTYGRRQGLAELEIPASFTADLDTYRLHPALLDTAISFLLGNYNHDEPYLQFLFKRVRVKGPLPRKIYSYSRAVEKPGRENSYRQKPQKSLEFNITIMDERGVPHVEIEGFTLVAAALPGALAPGFAAEPAGLGPLKDAILPAEGVEVFNRLLLGAPPQVMVSTTDLQERLRNEQAEKSSVTPGTIEAAPLHPRPELNSPYQAPANQTQQTLVKIWQQFIGIDKIGILDDFFELGGDSLKGLTVISEIHKALNVDLSITDLFTTPTIQGLAETAANAKESIYTSIAPIEQRQYYPLSSTQKRLYYLQNLRPTSVFYNISAIMMVEGKLDQNRREALENSFRTLIHRHESLRTSFHQPDEEPFQKVNKEVTFAIENDEPHPFPGPIPGTAQVINDFIRPFELSHAPLMRLKVVQQGEKKYLWLFDIHHIIADATGFAILHKELFKLYKGEDLPQLKIQYKDFTHWQNRLVSTGKIKEHQDYWLRVFSDGVPQINLPTDFPRPKVLKYQGAMHEFKLEKEETLKFLETGAGVGATLFINLLAALNVLLFKYTSQEDIVIGTTTAGRPHADLWEIVGMFVNMLPMRNFPGQHLAYVDFLQNVKANTLEAFEHQDLQFETLVEQLKPGVDTSRNPLFDICLTLQNYEQPGFAIEGLTFSHCDFQYKNAKFDMLLWANQEEDELHFMLEYSTELFKPATAQQFSTHFQEILTQVGQDKNIKLTDITLTHRVVNPTARAPQIDFDF